MLKSLRCGVLLAGAAAIMAPPVMAQVRDLDGEQTDVRVYQGRVEGEPAVFTVTIPADKGMRIDVIATDDFDPVLRVKDAAGELIVEDDDGGGELNSRARIGAEDRARQVTIEVDSFDAEWADEESGYGGSFELRLSTSDYVAVGTRPVSVGATETGTLMGEEHLFTLEAEAGQTVEIALVATDDGLDPYLELRDSQGGAIASDDDGGSELNSLLRHTFERSGTYTIAASGFGDSSGDYRLRLRERSPASAQLPLQVIGIDDTASGELAGGWHEGGDAAMIPGHIDYQLSEEALASIRAGNGEVSIRMNASEAGDPDFGGTIDPFIELGFDTPVGFAVVDSDDDGGGELNALLPIDLGLIADRPDLLGMLRIRAQGVGGSGGAYTLVITPGMEPRAEPNWDIVEEAVEGVGD